MIRWLLSGDGGLKNLAQLLTDSFGAAGASAATIDTSDGTITAYPADPTATPSGSKWRAAGPGWTHPFDPASMPLSATADHHVAVGITSRNELLVVNLAAAPYLGIEGAAPIPVMRSWMMQLLTKTPAAQVAITDPALNIPTAPRIATVDTPAAAPAGTSIVFTTAHTSAPTPGSPLLVSSNAAGAGDELLCDEAVSGIYIANRYWPLWRRLEIPDPQWAHIAEALRSSSAPAPAPPLPTSDNQITAPTEVAIDAAPHRPRPWPRPPNPPPQTPQTPMPPPLQNKNPPQRHPPNPNHQPPHRPHRWASTHWGRPTSKEWTPKPETPPATALSPAKALENPSWR